MRGLASAEAIPDLAVDVRVDHRVERRGVSVVPGRSGAGTLAVTLDPGKDAAPATTSPVPVGWTGHAAERFAERSRIASPRDAGALVRGIAARAVMALVFAEAAIADCDGAPMAVPSADGLLLGEARRERDPAALGLPVPPSYGGCAGWTATTYLGPREMAPRQREYVARWLALEAIDVFEALSGPPASTLLDLAANRGRIVRALGRARLVARASWDGMSGLVARRGGNGCPWVGTGRAGVP